MGVNLPGLERDSPSFFVGLGRDDIFFVGVGREKFENPLPCHPLVQWFSTFFSTGPHYGPSASLTGRTHVIYILRHQYKPTRFIILFIA